MFQTVGSKGHAPEQALKSTGTDPPRRANRVGRRAGFRNRQLLGALAHGALTTLAFGEFHSGICWYGAMHKGNCITH